MKNSILIFLSYFVFSINLYSQEYCEVDKVFTSFDREVGCGIIQTSDGNFVTISISGQNGRMKLEMPNFVINKIDKCGNVIWRNTFDYCYGCRSNVSGLNEEVDGSFVFGGYLDSNNPDTVRKDLRLYKISDSGQLIWSLQFGDSTKRYWHINSVKISSNRYLIVGSFDLSNYPNIFPTILMIDTLGNTISQNNFMTQTGYFISAHKVNYNNILILGSQGSNIIILNIDTNGNTLSSKMFPWIRGMEPSFLAVNKGLDKLVYVAENASDQTLLAWLDVNGNLIKDSLFFQSFLTNLSSFPQSHIQTTLDDRILIPGVKIILLDSNFHLKWEDENKNSPRETLSSLLAVDETVVSVGRGHGHFDGSYNVVFDYWFGAKSISSIAKAISINGGVLINKKHDTLQLSVSVLPATTINKVAYWEVTDTNLATITQTGLLTAKANGVVIVTATTTDGSKLSAQRAVTITNQIVGLEANSQLFQNIKIYPNPVKDYFEVDDAGLRIKSLEMLNVNGEVIYSTDVSNCTKPCMFSPQDLSNGIYFIRFHSDTASVLKKIAVFR